MNIICQIVAIAVQQLSGERRLRRSGITSRPRCQNAESHSCHSDSNVFLVIVSIIFNLTISKVGDSLPKEMWEQLEKMEKRIELFAEEEEEEEVDNY